jgi:PAS domain S-box-containing protein
MPWRGRAASTQRKGSRHASSRLAQRDATPGAVRVASWFPRMATFGQTMNHAFISASSNRLPTDTDMHATSRKPLIAAATKRPDGAINEDEFGSAIEPGPGPSMSPDPRTPSMQRATHRSSGVEKPSAKAMQRKADAFASMVGPLQLVGLILDVDGTIVYANERLLALTGWCADEVFGHSWFDLFLDQPCTDAKVAFRSLLASDPHVATYTLTVLKRSGSYARIHWHNALLRDGPDVIGTSSIGVVIEEDTPTDVAQTAFTPQDVIDIARAATDRPGEATLPLIKLVAEQCAQLAEERPEGAAAHIRSEFRVDGAW